MIQRWVSFLRNSRCFPRNIGGIVSLW